MAELDKAGIAKAYARWAPIYDVVFGEVFDRGRQASIAAAEQVGGRILEVGVGTGLSLPGLCPHQPAGRRPDFSADAAARPKNASTNSGSVMSKGLR